jgi:hypothetical protein
LVVIGKRASVMDCGGPPPLFHGTGKQSNKSLPSLPGLDSICSFIHGFTVGYYLPSLRDCAIFTALLRLCVSISSGLSHLPGRAKLSP